MQIYLDEHLKQYIPYQNLFFCEVEKADPNFVNLISCIKKSLMVNAKYNFSVMEYFGYSMKG